MSPENRTYWFRAVSLWFLLMMAETLHGLWLSASEYWSGRSLLAVNATIA